MDRFAERLAPLSVVGLDTAIFIYHLEENPTCFPLTQFLFSSIEMGAIRGITSTITLMEIIVKPLALGQEAIARQYETLLVNFPNLEIADLDRAVIRRAAQIRAAYSIRTPDALQLATGLIRGVQAIFTNDRRLERLSEELEVIVLDDFVIDRS